MDIRDVVLILFEFEGNERNDQHSDWSSPEFKQFLYEPGDLMSLLHLLHYNLVPRRIMAKEWRNENHQALNRDGYHWFDGESQRSGGLADRAMRMNDLFSHIGS